MSFSHDYRGMGRGSIGPFGCIFYERGAVA
jgi:hypothetical protein